MQLTSDEFKSVLGDLPSMFTVEEGDMASRGGDSALTWELMFIVTVGAGCVTWGAEGEPWGLRASDAGSWDENTSLAAGAVVEAAGLMVVDAAVGVAISCVDAAEAVSGPVGGEVSGGLWVLSGSGI